MEARMLRVFRDVLRRLRAGAPAPEDELNLTADLGFAEEMRFVGAVAILSSHADCRGSCRYSCCRRLWTFIQHVLTCDDFLCPTSERFLVLVAYHSLRCDGEPCYVPYCREARVSCLVDYRVDLAVEQRRQNEPLNGPLTVDRKRG